MFVACTRNSLAEVTDAEFEEENTFLSLSPRDWCRSLEDTWRPLLASMGLDLKSFNIAPVNRVANSEYVSFCFTVNDLDSFFLIPKDQLEKNLIFIDASANFGQVASLVVEYLVRKFLFEVTENLDDAIACPKFQFVGLESNLQIEETQKRFLNGVVKTDKFDLDFYVVLPDEFLVDILRNFPANSLFGEYLISKNGSDELFCRFDVSSFSIPTKELIDFVRKDKIIDLPKEIKADEVLISVENQIVAVGKLKKMREQILVSAEKAHSRRPVDPMPNETHLTISLAYKEVSLDELSDSPKLLKLEEGNYPEVKLLVSNEIIARGTLGMNEEGGLCVKIS